MAPLQNVPAIVPSVAMVLNLASSQGRSAADAAAVVSLIDRLELPATWVIDSPKQAKMLAKSQLAEFAITVEARSPQRLRTELSNLQAAVQVAAGKPIAVVTGDPQQLRSRAALLADQGIAAVVAEGSSSEKPPRLLPCGLWQFDAAVRVPQLRSRWALLPARRASLKQLLDSTAQQMVATIDLCQLGGRGIPQCERLLAELAEACRRGQLRATSVSQLAAELASQNQVKPQRSILRHAA